MTLAKEFIRTLIKENQALESENKHLQRTNEQFSQIIDKNHRSTQKSEQQTDEIGKELNKLTLEFESIKNSEGKFAKNEKTMHQNLYDMIHYVSLLTDQIIDLRQRTREAEKVIFQLRKSGETSVEVLLDTLFVLKKEQEKLDQQFVAVQAEVQQKELQIRLKEEQKSELKAQIEDESAAHEQQFSKIRNQLEETKMLIASQRKHLNQLQALNEKTQTEMTYNSQILSKQLQEKEHVQIQISEQEQAQIKLESRHSGLMNQINGEVALKVLKDTKKGKVVTADEEARVAQ